MNLRVVKLEQRRKTGEGMCDTGIYDRREIEITQREHESVS